VIAEVIGGIILGPSALGRIPGFTESVFPHSSLGRLALVANIGQSLQSVTAAATRRRRREGGGGGGKRRRRASVEFIDTNHDLHHTGSSLILHDHYLLLTTTGLILYLYLVGVELDPKAMLRHIRKTFLIALCGIGLPFGLGFAISPYLFDVSRSSGGVWMGVGDDDHD